MKDTEMKFDVPDGRIGCRSILEILDVSPEEREKIMKEAQKALYAASTVEIHKDGHTVRMNFRNPVKNILSHMLSMILRKHSCL